MLSFFSKNIRRFTGKINYPELADITSVESKLNTEIWLRGRLHTSRLKGNILFLVLRQNNKTIQCCMVKDKSSLKAIQSIPSESILDIHGKVSKLSKATSCTISEYEIQVMNCSVVSRSATVLPFQYEEGLIEDRVSIKTRLDNRCMDLRLPVSQTIFEISSVVCNSFREFLNEKKFIEIHTPKIIQGTPEGGSDIFHIDYFGKKAGLAQSPQLYKQMAVIGDFERVYEIGSVFRAENSNTHRHLCEFIGLDLEMKIDFSYLEIVRMVDQALRWIFGKIEEVEGISEVFKYFGNEKTAIGKDLVMVTFEESCEMLKENGVYQDPLQDLTSENEKTIGNLVKAKYGTDFYVIHKYPTNIRPFYTMPCSENTRFSNSFDFFLRGEEIASGSQRIHNYEDLVKSCELKKINTESISFYLESFKYGVYPHGGCGLGLERILMLYLGLKNIRLPSFFPRDPKRLTP